MHKKKVMKHKKCSSCGHKMAKSKRAKKDKIEKVMHEFKKHELHSGSKKGPLVKKPKQAIAIALSEAKRLKKNHK